MNNEFYRVSDVANHLDVGNHTVYRWIKSGLIPEPSRVGGKIYRWHKDVIDSWLKSKMGVSNEGWSSNIELPKIESGYISRSGGESHLEREHGDEYGEGYESSTAKSGEDGRRIV
jgi:prophage regulatory protein|tara:strand:+ start:1901 stop:2245 length:345 start_codon:yes stop_codon:yes gene_type:complete